MSGSIEGLQETFRALDRLGDDGREEGSKAVAATANKIRTDVIKEIQRGTKTGRIYTETFARVGGELIVTGTRKDSPNLSSSHRASAPGEAPASDTGRLVSSIKAVNQGLRGEVFSRLDYAFWLEYGTRYMEERPVFRPVAKKNESYFVEQMQAAVNRAAERFDR